MGCNAKQNLYNFISTLRRQYPDLNQSKLLGSFCNDHNIDLYMKNFDCSGFCGAAFVGKKRDTIVLNSNRDRAERLFDFIHEFIHTKKHRNEQDGEFACFNRKQNTFLEWEANEGSAEFLVPYETFIPDFCRLYNLYMFNYNEWRSQYYGNNVKQVLAFKYGVTEMVILHRIDNLSYEISQYMCGVPIEFIYLLSKTQQECKGITPPNLNSTLALEECRHDFDEIPWDGTLGPYP